MSRMSYLCTERMAGRLEPKGYICWCAWALSVCSQSSVAGLEYVGGVRV